MEYKKRITQSDLFKMGWTKTMIKRFLPEPILIKNPHYKHAPDIKLWDEAEVLKAMGTAEFKAALQEAERRKAIANKAVCTKQKRTEEKLSEIKRQIRVTVIPEQLLINRTIADKNLWNDYSGVTADEVDEGTLSEWIVDYIKNNLVAWNSNMKKLQGRTGAAKAQLEFTKAVLIEISIAYPKYADECQRQIDDLK